MTGKKLKSLRRQEKWTQLQLAHATGLNNNDICHYEATKRDLSLVNVYANDILTEFFKKRGKI